MEQSRNACRVLLERSDGKRPLGKPTYKWKGNIKKDLKEVGCDTGDWIDLALGRDHRQTSIRAVMNLKVT